MLGGAIPGTLGGRLWGATAAGTPGRGPGVPRDGIDGSGVPVGGKAGGCMDGIDGSGGKTGASTGARTPGAGGNGDCTLCGVRMCGTWTGWPAVHDDDDDDDGGMERAGFIDVIAGAGGGGAAGAPPGKASRHALRS